MDIILKSSILLFGATLIFRFLTDFFIPFGGIRNWDTLQRLYPEINSTQNKKGDTFIAILVLALLVLGVFGEFISEKYLEPLYPVLFLMLTILLAIDGFDSISSGVYSTRISIFYDEKRKYVWVAKSRVFISVIASLLILFSIIWKFS
jgi:hypothetical protein